MSRMFVHWHQRSAYTLMDVQNWSFPHIETCSFGNVTQIKFDFFIVKCIFQLLFSFISRALFQFVPPPSFLRKKTACFPAVLPTSFGGSFSGICFSFASSSRFWFYRSCFCKHLSLVVLWRTLHFDHRGCIICVMYLFFDVRRYKNYETCRGVPPDSAKETRTVKRCERQCKLFHVTTSPLRLLSNRPFSVEKINTTRILVFLVWKRFVLYVAMAKCVEELTFCMRRKCCMSVQ